MKNITVVGSINMDLVLNIDNMPRVGETLKGKNINYLIGGKGCNQAVAAARLDNRVNLIGAIGEDEFGDTLMHQIEEEGINVDVLKIGSKKTGIATILKTPIDNSIVIIGGANEECDKELLYKNIEIIKYSDVIITQFEVPIETVVEAIKLGKKYGAKTILNPAPARTLTEEILNSVDFITPNETEFEVISGKILDTDEKLEKEMILWQEKNKPRLIVTRGSFGVSYVKDGQVSTVRAMKVDAIDTTGAGDTFNGAFAHGIAHNMSIKDAITFGSRAASISVTKFGAQGGMPRLKNVLEVL